MPIFSGSLVLLVLNIALRFTSSTQLYPNHRYGTLLRPLGHRYHHHYSSGQYGADGKYLRSVSESSPSTVQQVTPFVGENNISDVAFSEINQHAERKISFYKNPKYYPNNLNSSKTVGSRKKIESFENFVTPREESFPRKSYEVTTEEFQDTEPDTPPLQSPLSMDSDLAIAIDGEEEVGTEAYSGLPTGDQHLEHLNPLVYVDSYGQLHKNPETDCTEDGSRENLKTDLEQNSYGKDGLSYGRAQYGQGYGYTVVHRHHRQRPGSYYHRYKKPAGRVRMQVFRGPTRTVGHRRYAQWGYYVVQPGDGQHHPQSW